MRWISRIYFIILISGLIVIPVFADDTVAVKPANTEDSSLAKLSYTENRWIALHFFLQGQIFSQDGYEDSGSQSWTKSSDLRRCRVILNGQVTKNIDFFMDTDDILVGNQGSGSQYSTTTTTKDSAGNTVTTKDSKGLFTQDAFINYKNDEAFQIVVGLIPIPFMHQDMESPISQLGVDYNSIVIPLGSTTNNWRDTGIEIRGIYKNVMDYKVGVFRGQPRYLSESPSTNNNVNDDAAPRISGRLQLNFMDAETGFFYSGNYLGKKNILSIGGGVDYQHNATKIDNKIDDYIAWTADAIADYKINNNLVVAFQGAYVNVTNQPGAITENQWGYFAQMGVLLYEYIQPVIKYQFWDGDTLYTSGVKTSYISFGLNYFISGHNANIKLEYQTPFIYNHSISGEKKATLQFQIFI